MRPIRTALAALPRWERGLRSALLLCAVPVLELGLQVLGLGAAASAAETFRVTSYRTTVRPDFETGRLTGKQTIGVVSTEDGTARLSFHPRGPDIVSAMVEGESVRVERRRNGLTFVLNRPLGAGERTVLELRTRGDGGRGVTFLERGVYSGYWACEWMVCRQNALGEAAQVEVVVEAPAQMTTLSVGELVETVELRDGYVAHRWRTERPYPAYLIGFAAGAFEVQSRDYGGLTLSVIDAAGVGSAWDGVFRDWRDMVGFLSEKAGLPLPVRHFRYLVVPGSAAQEAATYATIGEVEIRSSAEKPEAAWVVLHELAHQWWGNLVLCRDLSHFWLNEGIVVFLTAAWKEHRFGRDAYEAELGIARKRVSRAEAAGCDRPPDYDGSYKSLAMRRAVQYSKGALFMHHLRSVLGDQAFWTGFRDYTVSGAGRAVVTEDLLVAMAASSGRSLDLIVQGYVRCAAPVADPASRR